MRGRARTCLVSRMALALGVASTPCSFLTSFDAAAACSSSTVGAGAAVGAGGAGSAAGAGEGAAGLSEACGVVPLVVDGDCGGWGVMGVGGSTAYHAN